MRGGPRMGRRPQDPAEDFVYPAGARAQRLGPFLTAGSVRDARTRLGDVLTVCPPVPWLGPADRLSIPAAASATELFTVTVRVQRSGGLRNQVGSASTHPVVGAAPRTPRHLEAGRGETAFPVSLEKAGVSDTESKARRRPSCTWGRQVNGEASVQPIAGAVQNACEVFTRAEKPLFSRIA